MMRIDLEGDSQSKTHKSQAMSRAQYPIRSMYDIFTYIWLILMVNVYR